MKPLADWRRRPNTGAGTGPVRGVRQGPPGRGPAGTHADLDAATIAHPLAGLPVQVRLYDPTGGRSPKHGGEPRLTRRAAWLHHDGPLPIVEGTCC
ncbi:hypothetical protein [Streptomyces sp. NPDC059979]|uniref:hypothetical protein n=1 Tax=unclassified Streptomyces TaxID=2593676 RepID=UPI003667E79F